MRRIAVINQKGGVGKTTTTVNLGAALAALGRRVLVCDLDPQCNLTVHLDVDPNAETPSIYDLLVRKATLADVVRPTEQPGLDVAPAGSDLAGIELELASELGREVILRQAFEADDAARGRHWDFVLVDCPPSLGLLALNALVACDEVFVPVQAEFFALQGLGKLLEVVDLVQQRLNPRLRISGLVSCRHDPSTNLSKQVLADIRDPFGTVLLETVIRRNVKLAEAPSHGKTIFSYDPASRGADDYLALAREVLGQSGSAGPQGQASTEATRAVEPEIPEARSETGTGSDAGGSRPAPRSNGAARAGRGGARDPVADPPPARTPDRTQDRTQDRTAESSS